MDKKKIIVIGGGFTSIIFNLLIPISKTLSTNFYGNKEEYRKNLTVRKFLNIHYKSYGNLFFKLKKATLHDLPVLGGNSNIWGGFINLSEIPSSLISLLNKNCIKTIKLSYENTGSVSNKDIYQLRDINNNIFNSKSFKIPLDLCYVKKIKIVDNNIKIITMENNIYYADTLYLATGVVQTLDLLLRSGYLENESTISLDEYAYRSAIKFTFKRNKFDKKNSEDTIIRFNLLVAIKHLLGIQKNIKITRIFNWFPIYVEQIFFKRKNKLKLKLNNRTFSEEFSNINFGKSVHYCNLKINNIPINKYLKKIHKEIYGSGMAFISQKKRGSISNDIILDVFQRIVSRHE